jgi:FHS family L-fucose permease-like MFS transporter
MGGRPSGTGARSASVTGGVAAQRGAFASITTLFFAWGFITASIDPLIAALRAIFSLTYREAALTPFAFFIAYGVVSLPAAGIVRRAGYPAAIVLALLIMICGCLLIPVATHFETFAIVLVALFIIAGGITILQVAANPLAAELGAPEGAHFRLTFSQAFNSLGTTLAPFLIASLVLAGGIFAAQAGAAATAAQRAESLGHIDTAFFGIAVLIALLAFFIWRVRRRLEAAAPLLTQGEDDSIGGALRSRWALLGALAIFLYVGAEVSIGSYLTNFLNQPDVFGVPLEKAGRLVSFYWGGAMVGRFIGSALLRRVSAGRLLGVAAACAALLCLIVRLAPGQTAGVAALSVGLMNSIMFPVIFTLTLERSSASDSATSGLLCMAIIGGAVLPYITAHIADAMSNLRPSYVVPLSAYLCISVFGFAAARALPASRHSGAGAVAA